MTGKGACLQGIVLLAGQLLVLHDIGVRPHARVRRLVAHREGVVSSWRERSRKPPLAVVVFPVRDALGPAEGDILHEQGWHEHVNEACASTRVRCPRASQTMPIRRGTGGGRGRTESLASVGMLFSTDFGAVYCMRLQRACGNVSALLAARHLARVEAADTDLLSACSRSSCSSSSPTPMDGR